MLEGANSTTCIHDLSSNTGVWNPPLPKCIVAAMCPDPSVVSNLESSCTRNIGSSCEFRCATGYVLDGGTSPSECIEQSGTNTAVWRPALPRCRAMCPDPMVENNLGGSCTRSIGSSCAFRCATGYVLNGSSTSQCTEQSFSNTAVWLPELPRCREILCPSVNFPNRTNGICFRSIDTKCMSSCMKGYRLEGERESTCMLLPNAITAMWSPTLPQCIEITCPAPIVIDNSIPSDPPCSTSVGSRCSVTCARGYRLVGSQQRTCSLLLAGNNASWSPQLPRCEEIFCESPSSVITSSVKQACSAKLDSSCTFGCERGYVLDGASSSTCSLRGTTEEWNPSLPNCIGDLTITGTKNVTVLQFKNVTLNYTVSFTRDSVSCDLKRIERRKVQLMNFRITAPSQRIQHSFIRHNSKNVRFQLSCTQRIDGAVFRKDFNTSLTVEVPERISLSQTSVIVTRNSSTPVSVRCSSDGKPVPTVVWMRNARRVADSSTKNFYQTTSANSTAASSELILTNADYGAGGTFTCVASNDAAADRKEERADLMVNVIGAPELNLRSIDYVVLPRGNRVDFTCVFLANPLPSLRWTFSNGTAIPETSQYEYVENITNSYRVARTLTVYGVRCKETSLISYKCSATNQHGSTESGVFIAGISSQELRVSSRSIGCSAATRTCGRQGGNLVVVPNQEILNNINNIPTGNYWISAESLKYFPENTRVTPNNAGCVRIHQPTSSFSSLQQDSLAFALCEIRYAPEPEIISTIDECDGRKLEVEWNIIPGAMSFSHRVLINLSPDMSNYISSLFEPGEQSWNVTSLIPRTSYSIQVLPLFVGCENAALLNSTIITTGRGNLTAPSDVMLKFVNSGCAITWNSNTRNIEAEIGFFDIRVTQRLRNQRTATNFETNVTRINKAPTSYVIRNLQPNTDYQVEVGVVPSSPCEGRLPIVWSEPVNGTCVTSPSGPSFIKLSSVPPLVSQGQVSIILEPVSERNGLISCYFVVVQEATSNGSNAVEIDLSKLTQANESSSDGVGYVAIAMQRFNEKVNLGDGSLTCCDVTGRFLPANCSSTENNRKRRASSTVVRAQNRQLTPGANFTYYMVTSTPSDNGTIYTASPLSQPFVVIESTLVPGKNLAFIAGIVISIIVVIALIVVFILIYKKRRRRQVINKANPATILEPDLVMQVISPPIDLGYEEFGQSSNYLNVQVEENPFCSISDSSMAENEQFSRFFIQANDLLATYMAKRRSDDAIFKHDFEITLPQLIAKTKLDTKCAMMPQNQSKNRNRNVVPCDQARVVLDKVPPDPFSDYINASFVNAPSISPKYIAAQGPKENTVNDFWRMIYQYRCRVIVMMTQLKENYVVQCEKYWPDVGEEKIFGNVVAKTTNQAMYGDYICSQIIAEHSTSGEPLLVSHFQYMGWGESSVPTTTSAYLRFHREVVKEHSQNAGLMLVHCSLGTERTEAFVAFDMLKEQLETKQRINVYESLFKIRKSRAGMYQGLDYNVFLHKLLVETNLFGNTEMDLSKFKQTDFFKNDYSNVNSQYEFERLDTIPPLFAETTSARKPSNRTLNTDPSILPYDHNLALVGMKANESEPPYINASNIQAYHGGRYFIVAQDPLPYKVDLFWRCILDNRVKCIVMLAEGDSGMRYWAEENKSVTFKDITVSTTNVEESCGFSERTMEVFTQSEREPHHLKQLVLTCWPKDGVPPDIAILLKMILIVNKYEDAASVIGEKKCDALIHCRDGSSQAGTFCAISNLLKRLDKEKSVDIFRTVKDVRDSRAGAIGHIKQYELCYHAVRAFMQKSSMYENLK